MKKILPLIFSLFTLALLEWFVIMPQYLLLIAGLIIVANIILAWFLIEKKQAGWWKFILLPVIANLITGAYLVLLNNTTFLQFVMIALVIFNFIYWRFVYLYLIKSPRYVAFSLENLSFYINFILIFFLGSVMYGLRLFLNFNPLWLGLIVASFLALIIYQSVWVSKQSWKSWTYWLVGWLVLVQAFYVFMTLPLGYNLLGFFWASFYYLIFSLINDKLSDKLNKSKIKFYSILIIVSWLILLITARWL